MIRFSAMTPGFVFRDPEDEGRMTHGKRQETWYQVEYTTPEGVRAKHLLTGAPRRWTLKECDRLIAASSRPSDNVDLSCFVGQKVRLVCAHGIVTGKLRCVNFGELLTLVDGEHVVISYPKSVNLDGEVWSVGEVIRLEQLS